MDANNLKVFTAYIVTAVQNAYVISLRICNSHQDAYYDKYLPELLKVLCNER